MTCPKCGAKIADNAVMCPRCNSFMDDKPSSSNTQRTTSGNRSYTTPYTTAKPQKTGSGKKKSTALLIAAILGVLYALYSIFYWAGAASGSSEAEAIGAGIATALVMPHLICAVLAAIFNTLGWAMSHRGFSLTGAILYAVAMALFPVYFMFVIIQMILSFVGFANLKKLNG